MDVHAEGPDLKEREEEELWEMLNNHRHRISLGVKPCMLIPYLRQARVLSELDEDEILNSMKFTNRSMKTSHMLDLLRCQGRNGAMALLESLMIHYPKLYTLITGRKPSTEPSGFSGLINSSELTEYLVRAVTSMQRELQEVRREAADLSARCATQEGELSRAGQQGEEHRRLQAEHGRLRRHMAGLHRDVLQLKDEKCDLYMRYTTAVEDNSAVNIRCRDLQLQVYQLQFELRKAQTETDFQRQRSLKDSSSTVVQQLQEEVSLLRKQLLEAEKFAPAREDILVKDLEEARDGRTELMEQVHNQREENEKLAREREQLLEEKERLVLQVQKMSLDCEMYQQKSAVMQSQLRELQQERDQAYLLRDETQAQIARSLAEKDTLRGQLVELQEKFFSLQAQTKQEAMKSSWQSSPPLRPRLQRSKAICPEHMRSSSIEDNIEDLSSFRSECVEPPSPDSFRKRQLEEQFFTHSVGLARWDSVLSLSSCENEYVFISEEPEEEAVQQPPFTPASNVDGPNHWTTMPPFLVRERPKAMRNSSRVLTISFQGEVLLDQLEVIGGNKTGVFIHQVKEDSAAQNVGISPGAQVLEVQYEQGRHSLRMALQDSTLEEALWALGQVRGFCHLTLRPNQDGYEKLLCQLQNGEVTSGDSFYIRVNMSLPSTGLGALAAKCNDILHVSDTRHGPQGSWKASHVHPCQLVDLKGGTLPNYYRAQSMLIRAIEDMSYQCNHHNKAQAKQKVVRIISTGRLGRNPLWLSVEEDNSEDGKETAGDSAVPRGCVTLMPYTLVTPHQPPAARPVLLLPTVHGQILNKRLGELQGFKLCEPEHLNGNERTAQMQKAEILENCGPNSSCYYTLQSVERVMKRGFHCVLPLGLDCVRRLHRAEIFPIVIFITSSVRSVRKLRHKLHRQGLTEKQLLESYRNEEPLLDKLPCLYRTVPPDSWSDGAALLDILRNIVLDEQNKIVWVEPDLW